MDEKKDYFIFLFLGILTAILGGSEWTSIVLSWFYTLINNKYSISMNQIDMIVRLFFIIFGLSFSLLFALKYKKKNS